MKFLNWFLGIEPGSLWSYWERLWPRDRGPSPVMRPQDPCLCLSRCEASLLRVLGKPAGPFQLPGHPGLRWDSQLCWPDASSWGFQPEAFSWSGAAWRVHPSRPGRGGEAHQVRRDPGAACLVPPSRAAKAQARCSRCASTAGLLVRRPHRSRVSARAPEVVCQVCLHVCGRQITSSSMKSLTPVVKSHSSVVWNKQKWEVK